MKYLLNITMTSLANFLDSAEYCILKNGIVTGGSAKANRIIEIACELSEAKALLRVAQNLCPEAALEIDKGVTLARPLR